MKHPQLMTRDASGVGTAKVAERLRELRSAKDPHRRQATVGTIDVDARTVELSFSSEVEYERWWGVEILGHEAHEVDLSRLQNKAALLWMHNWDDQRGVVESVRIDGDRKGRAVVRFSKSPAGEQMFQDIVDGIVTKVSVGYTIDGLKLVEEREGIDVYRVTAWTPYEISMVSIPADDTVGVGRGLENPQEEARRKQAETAGNAGGQPEQRITQTGPNGPMKIKNLRDGAGNLVRAEVDEDGKIVNVLEVLEKAGESEVTASARGLETERARVRAIHALAKEYGNQEKALEFIQEGKSPEEFQRSLLGEFAAARAAAKPLGESIRDAEVGMSDKDVARYSLMNVARALANPTDARAQKAAAFELEMSAEAARKFGREARGIIIPPDVLARRAFNAGTNGQTSGQTGANLIATDLLAGSFIEMLRNRTTIMRLGTVLGGLVGNVEIPKQTGGATAYWLGEGEDAQEGTPVIGQIGLNPKTVAAYTDVGRKLLMQSTPDAEGIVVRDLRAAMSQAIDFAGYYGTGADNMPKGLKNYTGINAVQFANAQPTFAELVQMETEISADNADIDQMGYVGNARFRGHCKTATKFGAGTEATIWEPGNTVNGYRTEITNQVATGDTFFGNYADLIVALWGGLDMTVDPFSLSLSGAVRLVVFQDVDFVLRRAESICYGHKAP